MAANVNIYIAGDVVAGALANRRRRAATFLCILCLSKEGHPLSMLLTAQLLECLALQRISHTVKGLLSPDQAGFRKGRSTCDQVAALTTFIENGFQRNLTTGVVFLDLHSI